MKTNGQRFVAFARDSCVIVETLIRVGANDRIDFLRHIDILVAYVEPSFSW